MKLLDRRNRAALAAIMEQLEERLAQAETERENGPLRISFEGNLRDGSLTDLDAVQPRPIVSRGKLLVG